MKAKNFSVRLPENLQEAIFKHIEERELVNFIRVALVEKLQRDFGESVEIFEMRRGMRTDMKTEAGKAVALANLEKARRLKEDYASVRNMVDEVFDNAPKRAAMLGERYVYIMVKISNAGTFSFNLDVPDFFKYKTEKEARAAYHEKGINFELSREEWEKARVHYKAIIRELLNEQEAQGNAFECVSYGLGKFKEKKE